jgi:hypothetical protein
VRTLSHRLRQQPLLGLVLLLAVVGVLAVLVGLIYSSVNAASLPAFFPGHAAGVHRSRGARGHAGIVLGVFILIIDAVIATDLRKPKR